MTLTSDNARLSRPMIGVTEASLTTPSVVPPNPAREYLRAAISQNTRRAYQSDLRHFLSWGGSIPASDAAVAEYLAVHGSSLSIATLIRRLAAISKAHTLQGLP